MAEGGCGKTEGPEEAAGSYREEAAGSYREEAAGSYREEAAGSYREEAAGSYREEAAGSYREEAAGSYREEAAGSYREEAPGSYREEAPGSYREEAAGSHRGSGVCKWFNVRMGFGFLAMTNRDGEPLEEPVDVFVHQSKLHMEGFRSLKEGEEVEFSFKTSSKGLESVRVTGPGGGPCLGSEKKPKGAQKRRSKGDRCYNCGGPDHHAKECELPPQPKKCHFCQSTSHMVANCPIKAQQSSPGSQGLARDEEEEEEELGHSPSIPESSD